MVAEDQAVRASLVESGELHEGYTHQMAEVHERNAAELERIVAEHGWPDRVLAGTDGSAAAWLVLQHAIGNPSLQRRCLPLLLELAAVGRVPPADAAYLEDRIRVFEGRPQLYGTQYDWDDNGELSPCELEEPDRVDERRKAVGLASLAEATAELRARTRAEGGKAPEDIDAHRRRAASWARSVGWR